jgi:hypothetical protein
MKHRKNNSMSTTANVRPPTVKYHVNKQDEYGKCSAKDPADCPFCDEPHGSLEHVCDVVEERSEAKYAPKYAKQKARREKAARRKAQKSGNEPQAGAPKPPTPKNISDESESRAKNRYTTPKEARQKARREAASLKEQEQKSEPQPPKPTPDNAPKPSPTPSAPKPSAPKPSAPRPSAVPPPKPRTLPSVKSVEDTPLQPGDIRVSGLNGRTYILPSPKERVPETEEEYLIELEKQRIYLDRARYITERDEKIRNSKTPPHVARKLNREIEREKAQAEKNGVLWDVPQIRALWAFKQKTARKKGTRAHWPRLTKGQRQITYAQMDEASIERFHQHVKAINPVSLEFSGHVYEKLNSGKLAELTAEDVYFTLQSYTPGTYSVTEYDDKRKSGRSISIRSSEYSRVVAPEKGAPPEECNLILVLSIDPPQQQVVTAYWKPVNQFPKESGIRFQDRWLKVT